MWALNYVMNLITNYKNANAVADVDFPLVVDLDGTLINTDLLYEGFILLLRKNPLYLFSCLIWIFKGKAYLKSRILETVHIPAELLPYNKEVLDLLKREAGGWEKVNFSNSISFVECSCNSKNAPHFLQSIWNGE